jgi:hypothetical protein
MADGTLQRHWQFVFHHKFDGQLVDGLELFKFEPEANVNPDYKICG